MHFTFMDFLCTNPFGRIANPPSVDITSSYCLADWREDLKKVLLYAGVTGAPCVFLVADTQLKSEAFLEDVNNILTSGEVPNLFPKVTPARRPPGCLEGRGGAARPWLP